MQTIQFVGNSESLLFLRFCIHLYMAHKKDLPSRCSPRSVESTGRNKSALVMFIKLMLTDETEGKELQKKFLWCHKRSFCSSKFRSIKKGSRELNEICIAFQSMNQTRGAGINSWTLALLWHFSVGIVMRWRAIVSCARQMLVGGMITKDWEAKSHTINGSLFIFHCVIKPRQMKYEATHVEHLEVTMRVEAINMNVMSTRPFLNLL